MRHLRTMIILSVTCVMATLIGLGTAGTARATIVNAPGYVHLQVYRPGTCVDAQYAAPGTAIVMWRCLNTEFEEWQKVEVPIPGNRYEHCACTTASMFINHAMNLCTAVENNTNDTVDSGIPVVQQTCNTSDEKQWWLLPKVTYSPGGGLIKSFTIKEKVLDVDSGRADNGVPLQVWTNHLNPNQLWYPPAGCC